MTMFSFIPIETSRAEVNDAIYSVTRMKDALLEDQLDERHIETEIFFRAFNNDNFDQKTLDSDIFRRVERLTSGYRNRCESECSPKYDSFKKELESKAKEVTDTLLGLLIGLEHFAKKNETTAYLVKEMAGTILKNQDNFTKKCDFVENNKQRFQDLSKIDIPINFQLYAAEFRVKKTIENLNLSQIKFGDEKDVYIDLKDKWENYRNICSELNVNPDQKIGDNHEMIMDYLLRKLEEKKNSDLTTYVFLNTLESKVQPHESKQII